MHGPSSEHIDERVARLEAGALAVCSVARARACVKGAARWPGVRYQTSRMPGVAGKIGRALGRTEPACSPARPGNPRRALARRASAPATPRQPSAASPWKDCSRICSHREVAGRGHMRRASSRSRLAGRNAYAGIKRRLPPPPPAPRPCACRRRANTAVPWRAAWVYAKRALVWRRIRQAQQQRGEVEYRPFRSSSSALAAGEPG